MDFDPCLYISEFDIRINDSCAYLGEFDIEFLKLLYN